MVATFLPTIQKLVPLFNFFLLVPREGRRIPFCPRKPSSFPVYIPLQELRLLSSHSKTPLLPLQARFYMPKTPICTHFFCSGKESTGSHRRCLCGLEKNQIIIEVCRNPPFPLIKLHPSLQEETYM